MRYAFILIHSRMKRDMTLGIGGELLVSGKLPTFSTAFSIQPIRVWLDLGNTPSGLSVEC